MRVGLNDYPDETISDADIVERLNEVRLNTTVRNSEGYEAVDEMVEEIFKVLALREKQNVGDMWP
jgi:hypothetical protein